MTWDSYFLVILCHPHDMRFLFSSTSLRRGSVPQWIALEACALLCDKSEFLALVRFYIRTVLVVFSQWGFRNKSPRDGSHTNTRLTTSKLGLAAFENEHIGRIWTLISGPTIWVDTYINLWVNVYSWKSRLTTRRARKTWISRIELNSPCWCRTNRRVGLCIKKSESHHRITSWWALEIE